MDPLDEPKNERTNKRMGLQISFMPDPWWCWRLFQCGRSRQEVTQGTANQIKVLSPGSNNDDCGGRGGGGGDGGHSVIRMAVVMSAVNVDDDVQLAIRNSQWRLSYEYGQKRAMALVKLQSPIQAHT
jgi:hypothetical protein